MEAGTYAVEAKVEASHWWFVGRRKLLSELIASLRVPQDARVLDIGSGTGTNLRLLREMGFVNGLGLDSSDDAIRWCAEKGLGKVEKGDVTALPFGDGEFGLVLATDVIEHVDDDSRALAEIRRVLGPGGVAIVTVPAFPSLWGLQDEVAHHKQRYVRPQLRTLIQRSGLACEDSFYFNYLLLVPIWLARQLLRLGRVKLHSENQLNTPLLNRILTWVFLADVSTARLIRPPAGVSIVAVARRTPRSEQPRAMGRGRSSRVDQETIADFGDQWSRYTDNEGFYGSVDLLADILGPLVPLSALQGKRVADIGSGTGRIVRMLLNAGAGSVLAVEPSRAIEALRRNLRRDGDRVEILHASGDALPAGLGLDYVVSVGVLHHIPDPGPVLAAAHGALRPGGRVVVWLYGKEGNRLTISAIEMLRSVTTRLPHWMLSLLARAGNVVLDVYIPLCRPFPFLPLADYMRSVLGKFDRGKRRLVIYDQLRPAYAKYYTRDEARNLLERAGFVDVQLHHRHGYSWTVVGRRPTSSQE